MRLTRSTPRAEGLSPLAVANFLESVKAEGHELHSFMLLKGGKVVAERFWEPYAPQYRHQMFSLSKSFTSIGVGIAVDEGLLTVDTLLSDIFADEFKRLGERVDDEVRTMTVKHLLTMSTGMEYENWFDDNIIGFLSAHVKDAPGETFRYNTLATFMLSAAITRLTGERLVNWLKPRLFEPLDIEPYWEFDKRSGASMGGFGLNITTEDIAVFGQFLLQKGEWNGKRLVSERWIDDATAKQISNGANDSDWGMGYGYQFWRCKSEGVYRGDGMYGQFCVVSPARDIVIAATSNGDMGKVMDLFWRLLKDIDELPADEGEDKLAALDGLSHLHIKGGGEWRDMFARYEFVDYDPMKMPLALVFDCVGDECVVTCYDDPNRASCGSNMFVKGKWIKSSSVHPSGLPFSRTYNYGYWDGNAFVTTIWFYETASRDDYRFTFSGDFDELTLEYRGGAFNSKFELIGKAKKNVEF